jgi:hypothetical protein
VKTTNRVDHRLRRTSRTIDLARRLTEAIWHMLTRNQPFAPKGATDPLAA